MMNRTCLLVALAVLLQSPAAAQALCATARLAVQVLGSGGPFAGTDRASSGYLVWRNGRAVVMVDAGGGTYLRFGESGARLNDLSMLAISHLHPDHTADLPALMWLSESARERPLMVSGPSGAGRFPDVGTFVERLFDARTGAFSSLGGALGQSGRGVRLEVKTVDADSASIATVLSEDGIIVTATGVPHGVMQEPRTPTLAYRVQLGERSIVFSSDQNGTDEGFVSFAQNADVLVMHLPVSMLAPAGLRELHATPDIVGRVASESAAERLVLSHFSDTPAGVASREFFSLPRLDENVSIVRQNFAGPVVVAEDLQCIVID